MLPLCSIRSACGCLRAPIHNWPWTTPRTSGIILELIKDRHLSSSSSSGIKKPTNFQIQSARSGQVIQKVIEQNKRTWQEKKDDIQRFKTKIADDIKERKDDIQKFKTKIADDIKEKKEKVKEVKERMEEVIEKENVLTIPNLLCLGRIALSPYLGYMIVNGDFALGMGILGVAGITDLLDGYIARTWPGQASRFGSFLDPMSDKILIGCLVVSLTYSNLFPLWLTGLILSRDVLLILIGFVIRYKSLPPPRTLSRYFDVTHATAQLAPTFISKANTVVQIGVVALSLGAPIWNYVDHPYLHFLWYFTGFTTLAAAVSYCLAKDTYKILKKQ